jgi:pyruvate carboxylase subunit B
MLSNLVSQLREQNALDKLSEVWAEVPRVRADFGYPPLVTPTSQLVGTQAVLNVLSGERYKKVTKEVKDYLLGYYGRPPGPINEEVRKLVIGSCTPITVRPADLLEPELDRLRADARKLGILHSEEDLITYALYPQVAVKFLRGELKEEIIQPSIKPQASDATVAEFPTEFSVDVDGEVFNIKISSVLGKPVDVEKSKKKPEEQLAKGSIVSPLSGMVLSIKVKEGDRVKEGDLVVMIEAMKMQNEVRSPFSGLVKAVMSYEGELVHNGNVLLVVDTEA